MSECSPFWTTRLTARSDRQPSGPGICRMLGRCLQLPSCFVMVAEILVFVPSVSSFRRQWLTERGLRTRRLQRLPPARGGELPKALRDRLLGKRPR